MYSRLQDHSKKKKKKKPELYCTVKKYGILNELPP